MYYDLHSCVCLQFALSLVILPLQLILLSGMAWFGCVLTERYKQLEHINPKLKLTLVWVTEQDSTLCTYNPLRYR